jgi:DNA polymerase-3 subunit gamma/tau
MFDPGMSYLVLARKYRPQTFEQVIGQEHVTRTLQNAIERGRVHHAFLFCGGRGTGKTTTARILAKALSCDNAPTPQPCNVCPACVEITQGTSVDVQEIDAASQNRVEDIRDLREAIRYAPVRGKKKLYILDEVHMLSTSAFNALLKTLEEPPPHAVFVFATTDPHKLPQTILSRVQRYDFKLVASARLVDHLSDVLAQERIEFERGALQLVAREGAGSVRDSLSLLDQVLASSPGKLTELQVASVLGVADRGLILSLGRAIVERKPADALALVDTAYQRGFDLVQLARVLLGHMRDLVVVSVVKEPTAILETTGAELEELQAQAQLAQGRAVLLFDRMVRVADDAARAALTRYVLEVGLVELCAVAPLQPVGELLDRLEHLEDRLSGKVAKAGGSGGGGYGPRNDVPVSRTPSQSFGVGEVRTAAIASAPSPARSGPLPSSDVRGAPSSSSVAQHNGSPAAVTLAHGAGVAVGVAAAVASAAVPKLEAAVHVEPPRVQLAESPAEVAAASDVSVPPSRVQAPPVMATPVGATAAAAVDKPSPAIAPIVVSTALVVPASVAAADDAEFNRTVAAIIEKDRTLSFLAQGRPLVWTQGRVELGFTSQFVVDSAKERLAQLRAAFASELGRAIEVDARRDTNAPSEEPVGKSLLEEEERARKAELSRRRREALEHPARAIVTEVFGEVSFQEPKLDEVNLHV